MRIFAVIASLLMLAAAPAFADPVCDQSKININDVFTGKDPVNGIREGAPRMKGAAPYTEDKAGFFIDAHRELADLRSYCRQPEWPDYMKPDAMKATLVAAAKGQPSRFCSSGGRVDAPSAPELILTWMQDEETQGFAHRIKETSNSYDPFRQDDWDAATHLQEASWLRDVAKILADNCDSKDAPRAALAAATSGVKFSQENVNFVACVKAREPMQAQYKAFDTLAGAGGDAKKLKAALADIEKAATPVRKACKPSEEGLREVNYAVASRVVRTRFLDAPDCQAKVMAMSAIRTDRMNAITAPDQLEPILVDFRAAAKEAKKACKNESAVDTWAGFVEWIAKRNLTRINWTPAQ